MPPPDLTRDKGGDIARGQYALSALARARHALRRLAREHIRQQGAQEVQPAAPRQRPRKAASVDEEEHSGMACFIALTQGWTVRVDPWWHPLLRGYRWQARPAGREGRWRYAGRSLRTPRGLLCVAMARV